MSLPQSIQNLIDEFSKLPGVGPKTAARLTFYLLTVDKEKVKTLGETVLNLREKLVYCKNCYNISEEEVCRICQDTKRNPKKIMVVEEPLDVVAMEKAAFDGRYHVLGGVISPVNGVSASDLNIKPLIDKVKQNPKNFEEIILATDPSLEGEATAMYIYNQLKPYGVKITRIARGLPVGGDLEYADEITLSRSLEGRREYQ